MPVVPAISHNAWEAEAAKNGLILVAVLAGPNDTCNAIAWMADPSGIISRWWVLREANESAAHEVRQYRESAEAAEWGLRCGAPTSIFRPDLSEWRHAHSLPRTFAARDAWLAGIKEWAANPH